VTGAGAAEGAAQVFAKCYGAAPEGIWYSPGRVNLIGEHTDYNEGFALPFAISAGVCVAASRGNDGNVALASRQMGDTVTTFPLSGLAPGAVRGWAAYPAGMAWALASAGLQLAGARIAIDADLALGAGLSSSAALECAAGLALADLYGQELARPALAALGRLAENDFVGAPTGLMDQMAVLLCTAGHALLLDCQAGAGTLVPFDTADLAILVIDTRARHELTDGGYAARRRACEEAARALGVRSLREVTEVSELDRLADPLLYRRALHVVTENGRVLETARLLRAGQLGRIGPLLTASHLSLRDDFEVSWPEADVAVTAAGEAGALGARMTGGGFGGSVIAVVPAWAAGAVTAAVDAGFAARGWRRPRISQTQPCDGARRMR
jgi:galactokinase